MVATEVGVLVFIPAIMAALGVGQNLINFITPLPYPLNLAGPVVVTWLGLGVLYLLFLFFSGRGDRARALNQLYVSDGPTAPSPRSPDQGVASTTTPTSA